jgi:tRNA splicing endonuclease
MGEVELARKKYSWAKGYDQRQKDRQLDLEKRQLKKEKKKQQSVRKGNLKRMKNNDKQLQELAEAAALAELEAKNYKKAWEAEKEINRAKHAQIESLQRLATKNYKRGLLVGWLLATTFIIIGFLISFAIF